MVAQRNRSRTIKGPMTVHCYRVTTVFGDMIGRIEVGETICEKDFRGADYTWEVCSFATGKSKGGFAGDYLGTAFLSEDGKLRDKQWER